MNHAYKQIILVTDTSKNSAAAGQTALDLAKIHSAKLLIVDTVRRPSLMSQWFSNNVDDLFDIVVAEKQERLDKYARTFIDSGIKTECRLLIGNSSEEIARAVLVTNADLVVRYMKGLKSRMPGPFGTTARNLMRVCPCPLLLVADKPVSSPNVLACVNAEHGTAENGAIMQEAEKLAGSKDRSQILYCWNFYGSEYVADYVSENTMMQYLNDAERNYRSVFEKFLSEHKLSPADGRVHMEQGNPVELIPEYCRQESVDVVVMSSASQNHPLQRLLGSTVVSVLDELPCSLLVVKPIGFKSPVKPSQSTVAVKPRQES